MVRAERRSASMATIVVNFSDLCIDLFFQGIGRWYCHLLLAEVNGNNWEIVLVSYMRCVWVITAVVDVKYNEYSLLSLHRNKEATGYVA